MVFNSAWFLNQRTFYSIPFVIFYDPSLPKEDCDALRPSFSNAKLLSQSRVSAGNASFLR